MAVPNYLFPENTYNSDFYTSIFYAALSVASPFLVQQKNQSLPSVTSINGQEVVAGGNTYQIHTDYINPPPSPQPPSPQNNYYAATPTAFQAVWPTAHFPNALCYSQQYFNATIDCVGFGTRVLIATGADQPSGNAYRLLIEQIDPSAAHFSEAGFVPSAFEYAVGLPVLVAGGRWSYVAGSVDVSLIQQQAKQAGKQYYGAAKGGFSTAQAGDILCFGYEFAASNGHFMVLTEAPQQVGLEQFGPLPGVTAAYMISVYDSTDKSLSLHFNDSRADDDDSECGVGFGQLYLFTNSADEPIGFIFGPDGTGMEGAHFINEAGSKLSIAAITLGRFA